jgi:hypothetical protein
VLDTDLSIRSPMSGELTSEDAIRTGKLYVTGKRELPTGSRCFTSRVRPSPFQLDAMPGGYVSCSDFCGSASRDRAERCLELRQRG